MFKFLKGFRRNYEDWDDFMSTVTFYRCNPHSIPGICQLLCKMGRHDYEAAQVVSQNYVMLECFYCGRKKGSSFHRS